MTYTRGHKRPKHADHRDRRTWVRQILHPLNFWGPGRWVKMNNYTHGEFLGKHLARLTWNLRIHPWKRRNIFQTIIFRFYVNLGGCIMKFCWWMISSLHVGIERPTEKPTHGCRYSAASWLSGGRSKTVLISSYLEVSFCPLGLV